MARTATQIRADIDAVNAALGELISGNRLAEFRVGSGASLRMYRYQEISVDMLKALRTEFELELQALLGSEPTFRTFGHLPMIVKKGGI